MLKLFVPGRLCLFGEHTDWAGHNFQTADRLRIYLPGNGALLTAVAMMCAGWDGCNQPLNPGFPKDGSWNVRWEGLQKMQ